MKILWGFLYVASHIKLFSMFGVVAESFLRFPVPVPPRFERDVWASKFQQDIRRQKKKEEKPTHCQQRVTRMKIGLCRSNISVNTY